MNEVIMENRGTFLIYCTYSCINEPVIINHVDGGVGLTLVFGVL